MIRQESLSSRRLYPRRIRRFLAHAAGLLGYGQAKVLTREGEILVYTDATDYMTYNDALGGIQAKSGRCLPDSLDKQLEEAKAYQ